jgi:hypothetical protein
MPSTVAHLARPRTVAQPRSMGGLSAESTRSEALFRRFRAAEIR